MKKKITLLEKILTQKQIKWCSENREHPKFVHMYVCLNETHGALYYPCWDAKQARFEEIINEFKKYLVSIEVS